jgi:Spy/CpxP family protein refolding chaperone
MQFSAEKMHSISEAMRSEILPLNDAKPNPNNMKSNIHSHLSIKTALAIMLAGAAFYTANVNAADPAKPDPAVAQQLSDAQMKATQLQGTLAQNAPRATVSPAAAAMPGMGAPGMSGAAPGAMKSGGMGDDKMMAMMGQMMGKMDKMMPMMEKMMGGGMGGKMGGGGMSGAGMPAAAPVSGGGMGMDMDDKDEMAGMMGMSAMGGGAAAGMSDSALPGFPGASHIYHIGATDFFLDHPQHIALTTEQQVGLNKIKDQALLAKSAADRAIEQAEQELAILTAADQPDLKKVEAKVRDIATLGTDERIAFIKAVGEAAKLLTADQRKSLTGFAPPAPAMPMTAPADSAPPMPMKDM